MPIIRRMLYDFARVDHKNSENLEEIETITIIVIISLQFLCATLLTLCKFLTDF